MKDEFKEVPLRSVFDGTDGLYEFKKKEATSKDLASYLLKNLRELLRN